MLNYCKSLAAYKIILCHNSCTDESCQSCQFTGTRENLVSVVILWLCYLDAYSILLTKVAKCPICLSFVGQDYHRF